MNHEWRRRLAESPVIRKNGGPKSCKYYLGGAKNVMSKLNMTDSSRHEYDWRQWLSHTYDWIRLDKMWLTVTTWWRRLRGLVGHNVMQRNSTTIFALDSIGANVAGQRRKNFFNVWFSHQWATQRNEKIIGNACFSETEPKNDIGNWV